MAWKIDAPAIISRMVYKELGLTGWMLWAMTSPLIDVEPQLDDNEPESYLYFLSLEDDDDRTNQRDSE